LSFRSYSFGDNDSLGGGDDNEGGVRTNFTFCSLNLSFRSNGSFDGGNSNGADKELFDGGNNNENDFGASVNDDSNDSFCFLGSSFRSTHSFDGGNKNESGSGVIANDGSADG